MLNAPSDSNQRVGERAIEVEKKVHGLMSCPRTARREPFDGDDRSLHLLSGRYIRGVDPDSGRHHASVDHRFLEPQQHVIAGSMLVISEVMVETQLIHAARLEKGYGFFGPANPVPAFGGRSLIIKKDLHVCPLGIVATQFNVVDCDALLAGRDEALMGRKRPRAEEGRSRMASPP